MSDDKTAPIPDVKALQEEVDRKVEEKKAAGLYNPIDMRKVEEAALCYSQAMEDVAAAEVSLRYLGLQKIWDTTTYGVSTHRPGFAGKLVTGAKKLIYKLTKFPMSVWLASQVTFNDELVKLLSAMAPAHVDMRSRLPMAEQRIEDLEDLCRELAAGLRRQRELEGRLEGLEHQAARGKLQLEPLLARLERLVEGQAQGGAAAAGAAQQVREVRQKSRGASYLTFEDIHRGSREDIKERQLVYLPYFQKSVGPGAPLLDIGCGRGEFLEAAREAGLPTRGIDINPEMAAHCQSLGLEAVEADALEHMRSLPDDSLGGVLMAQVIEHLEVDDLSELISLCSAKLAPGGVLIAETINPQCLTTFSGAFYLDLTHKNPIHPEAARFLWRQCGLREVEVVYMAPYPPDHRLESIPEPQEGLAPESAAFNRNMDRLNQLLFSHQDYAVVGRK